MLDNSVLSGEIVRFSFRHVFSAVMLFVRPEEGRHCDLEKGCCFCGTLTS